MKIFIAIELRDVLNLSKIKMLALFEMMHRYAIRFGENNTSENTDASNGAQRTHWIDRTLLKFERFDETALRRVYNMTNVSGTPCADGIS